MKIENTSPERISAIVSAQKAYFHSGATLSIKFRKRQLKAMLKGLQKWEKPICDALWEDLHKSYEEAYMTEIGLVYGEIRAHLRHVGKWAKKRHKHSPLALFPSSSYLVKEPLGTALILSPWNYPVQLLLNPLVGAISSGCTAVLKPSPYVPHVSKALEDMIRDTFAEEYVAIVQGNRDVNTALLKERYDLIFLTGSPSLGKIAMRAAAENLTPLVLELGGKSPCIVDKDADVKIAARRIAWGKCLNSGQTCIAPDYLFLHTDIKEQFIEEFKSQLKYLYKGDMAESPYYVHMVRREAFERVVSYLNDGQIVAGGRIDSASRFIEPTLLDGVSPESKVMTEEIFGPIFPIMTFSDLSEVREFVSQREKPLAFYYFGDKKKGWQLISETTSGGACINDTIMHIANGGVPFGGVGNSGMGSYHGKKSFDAFTHERTVVTTPKHFDLPLRYMPYSLFPIIKKLL